MRVCACGCGKVLRGASSRRFVNATHRQRAYRQRDNLRDKERDITVTDRDSVTERDDGPTVEPGRCRVGLEEWIEQVGDLPPALLAHARMLADEVDAEPSLSPMHGRYQSALNALIEASTTVDPEAAAVLWTLRADCDEPAHAKATGGLVHCAICCTNQPNASSTGRWLYSDDGQPLVWIPSDDAIRAEALAGSPVVIAGN